jgi:protein-disulfide isomerase
VKKILLAVGLALAAPLVIGANGNWNATAAETAGGHLLGNPEADVRLTEWVSYTCSHCAHFEQESEAPLKLLLVRDGRVAVEVRHFIRDPVDLTITAITNCIPDNRFFATHTAFLLSQDKWIAKARVATPAQQQRWTSGAIPARLRAVAGDLDFYEMMESRGTGRTDLDRCFANEAKIRALANQSQADIAEYSLAGTPSFAINGKVAEGVHDWASLQKALNDAL